MKILGLAVLVVTGCTAQDPQVIGGAGGDGNGAPGGIAGMPSPGDPGVTGGGGGVTCYSETVNLGVSIDDLKMAFQPGGNGNWLSTSLAVLQRRQPGGYQLLDAQKDDSQLPGFVESQSFPDLMMALMTMCHEETHGYDYGNATVSLFTYYMTPTLTVHPTAIETFPRAEIMPYLTDDSTQSYDQTYLTGTQGTYGFIEMIDELNAYTNGLACIAAVGDHIQGGISARDGAVAHLYYLELYLRVARQKHPTVYAALKGDASWQKLVRYAWARVHFWADASKPFSQLAIADQPIWAHVNDPLNLAEIQMFTGEDPAKIVCTP